MVEAERERLTINILINKYIAYRRVINEMKGGKGKKDKSNWGELKNKENKYNNSYVGLNNNIKISNECFARHRNKFNSQSEEPTTSFSLPSKS